MVELVKKEDTKSGSVKKEDTKDGSVSASKLLSLGEKKMVAGLGSVEKKPVVVAEPLGSGIPGGTSGTSGSPTRMVPEMEVAPPDQDIKDIIAKLQGGVGTGGEGSPSVEGEVPGLPPIDISIIKGFLYTVYRLPGVVYRVKGYKPPEEVMVDIDDQAQQLHTIMIRYGIADIKYIDLLVFGGGFAMNMANCIGTARDLRDNQLVDREKKLEADRIRMEMEEKRLREETDKIARTENEIRQRGPGEI